MYFCLKDFFLKSKLFFCYVVDVPLHFRVLPCPDEFQSQPTVAKKFGRHDKKKHLRYSTKNLQK